MMRRKRVTTHKSKRRVRPRLIVLGDGETEAAYIGRLKELDCFPNVTLHFEKGNEENFETKLKEHAANPHVVVLLDVDNVQTNTRKHHDIQRLLTTKAYRGHVFYNNYSFETWLLNHVGLFAKPVVKPSDYDKPMADAFGVRSWSSSKSKRKRTRVMRSVDKASVRRAHRHVKNHVGSPAFNNPSSNMDRFVDMIGNIKCP